MKVTVLLRNDHDAIRALVARHQKAGGRDPNQRRVALDQIRRGILIHDQMEEEIFHPALISPAGEQVESAKAEHQNIATLLHELDEMAPHDRNFEAKLDELLQSLEKHFEQEEELIFDAARKNLPEYRLEQLGLEMEDRRKILVQLAA